jgi:iron complex transport system ATP-binding protein
MLRAEAVSFGYGNGAAFSLTNATVDIAPGSLTGLLGPNGCGKTTLLKLLCGVLRPHGGRIVLGDRPLSSIARRELARHVAVVPQETHPAFEYSVMEMVLMGRHPHLRSFQLEGPADFEIARQSLEATGTAQLADRNYMTLSGGEKQRVIIASALAQATELLLLDEPTASLDLGYQLEIAALLARLNHERKVTMVLATHDLNLAASICDRLIVMRDGRVLAQGATSDVLTGAMVRQLYEVDADVQFHPRAGHLTVVPVRRFT